MLMMLPKLARARRQIEKIAAGWIIFRQRCQRVNGGKRAAAQHLQQNGGGFVPGVGTASAPAGTKLKAMLRRTHARPASVAERGLIQINPRADGSI